MKRFKRGLAAVCVALLACILAPAAFAERVPVSFDACGGTGIQLVEMTGSDNILYILPTPTMEGYTFEGWYTDPADGTKVESGKMWFGESTTIYAHWSSNYAPGTVTTGDEYEQWIEEAEDKAYEGISTADTGTGSVKEVQGLSGEEMARKSVLEQNKGTILIVGGILAIIAAGFVI